MPGRIDYDLGATNNSFPGALATSSRVLSAFREKGCDVVRRADCLRAMRAVDMVTDLTRHILLAIQRQDCETRLSMTRRFDNVSQPCGYSEMSD